MSNRVSLLILAELGLGAAACAETPPNHNAEIAAPLVIPPMPSASASPPARPPIPPPTPAPTATITVDQDDDDFGGPTPPRPSPPGAPCRTTKDCKGARQVCSVPTGRKVGSCQTIQVIRGRPLVVDGRDHFAEYTRPSEPAPSDDEIATLRQAAREEHASIAAFARTIAELMALGAPTWLLAETQRAMGDEIRHTERTRELRERLSGARPELGPLPAAVAPLARSTEEFFRDVLRGGAIGETLAAEDAERRRLATNDPELRAYYDMIVIDEARHAALAVKTLRWLTSRSTARA
jgi:hypothetical protein